jgi:hypothetical protein
MEPMSNTAGGGVGYAETATPGSSCDDCGCDHGVYPVTQRGARYLLCESCYEYAAMVADADAEPEAEEVEDDFYAEEDEEEGLDWDDQPTVIVGSAAWWAGGEQDARDNGAYDLLTSAGGW